MTWFKRGDRVRLTGEVLGYPAGTEVEYFAPHVIKGYHTLLLAEGKTLCPKADHFARVLTDEEIARDVAARRFGKWSPDTHTSRELEQLCIQAIGEFARIRDERDKSCE